MFVLLKMYKLNRVLVEHADRARTLHARWLCEEHLRMMSWAFSISCHARTVVALLGEILDLIIRLFGLRSQTDGSGQGGSRRGDPLALRRMSWFSELNYRRVPTHA